MADPLTSNIGLAIPTRGSDVGTWDLPINGDMNAIDGLFGGVLSKTIAAANITLTAPAGLTPAPSAGPVESQNAVIKLTGAQSANVQVTLPVPGFYIIDNQITTLNFVTTFRAIGAGRIIGVPQGMVTHIYNDGTNVSFVGLGQTGRMEFLAGVSAVPAWIAACTVPPFLLEDGAIYNVASFPTLGGRLGSIFGGNGSTTFGVPDLRGRVPLAYDGTGTRITSGVSNLNGQALGAAGGDQNAQAHSHNVNILSTSMNQNQSHSHGINGGRTFALYGPGNGGAGEAAGPIYPGNLIVDSANIDHQHSVVGSTAQVLNGSSGNIPPAQVAGIWLIKT